MLFFIYDCIMECVWVLVSLLTDYGNYYVLVYLYRYIFTNLIILYSLYLVHWHLEYLIKQDFSECMKYIIISTYFIQKNLNREASSNTHLF